MSATERTEVVIIGSHKITPNDTGLIESLRQRGYEVEFRDAPESQLPALESVAGSLDQPDKLLDMLLICQEIGCISECNGAYQTGLAVRIAATGKDIMLLTVADLLLVSRTHNDMYNKIHGEVAAKHDEEDLKAKGCLGCKHNGVGISCTHPNSEDKDFWSQPDDECYERGAEFDNSVITADSF